MRAFLIIVILSFPLFVKGQCPQPVHPDYEALIELYSSTNGDNWFNNDGWKEAFEGTSCDPCDGSWYGIDCEYGRVSSIDLDGNPDGVVSTNTNPNNLTGEITELTFTNLKFLNLFGNSITGNIPILDEVPMLEDVNFGGNRFENEIPLLDKVPNLKSFCCSYNSLTGNIPVFNNLPNLEEFSCSYNSISGELPELNNVPLLRRFDCRFNNISGEILNLDNVPALLIFGCEGNNLSGQIPNLNNTPELIAFVCSDNNFSGEIPLLDKVPKLGSFFCSGNNLTGFIPNLDNVGNISFLCNDNQLYGCYPDQICNISIFNSRNNSNLPWQGNHNPFCSGTNQIGAPCDDLDPSTQNDLIQADCSCRGESQDCVHPDYDALMELYNSTNGDNWTNTTNGDNPWDQSCDPCDGTWFGIECENSRVTCIDLDGRFDCNDDNLFSGNNLIGILPTLNFAMLIKFDVHGNNISGEIPSLDNVPQMESFRCHSNLLSGVIPDLSNLPKLIHFSCSSNNLQGTIPVLESNPLLKDFHCSSNSLTGNIPNLDKLNNLQNFSCSGNSLTGNIPNLDSLIELENFVCTSNELTGNIPSISNNFKLFQFRCDGNFLSGSLPDFSNSQSLTYFECSGNNLDGEIPDLSQAINLLSFRGVNNNLSGQIPQLESLTNLRQFICRNNNLTGCYPNNICSIPEFITLNNPLLPYQGDHIPFCNGEEQIGAPCDDSDPSTANDQIQNDCSCSGIPEDCTRPDYNALIDLYISTNGDNWTNTVNGDRAWDQSCDPCDGSWYGIECENNRVTCIDLDGNPNCTLDVIGNNLEGIIPNIILPTLKIFILSGNDGISGQLPMLDSLINMEVVRFDNCNLSGNLPNYNLPNLRVLSISNNDLTGELPDMNLLPNIEFIRLNENAFEGSIPEFASNPLLNRIRLQDNNLSGCYPSTICNIQDISYVNNPLLPWQGDHNLFCNGDEQIGAPCDDLDPQTANDQIQEDCICGDSTEINNPDCLFDLQDDLIETRFNTPTQINVLANDTYPSESVFTVTEYDNSLIQFEEVGDVGFLDFTVIGNFSDTIKIIYEVCDSICLECNTAILSLVNEDLAGLTLTNVISPNDDGSNDVLRFNNDPQLPDSKLTIFNRWGDAVFTTENYENDWKADGLPGGVYFYVLEVYGLTIKRTLTVFK